MIRLVEHESVSVANERRFLYTLFYMNDTETYIYGRHAVKEALKAKPEAVKKVYVAEDVKDAELGNLLSKTKISSALLNRAKLPEGMFEDSVHQGVAAVIVLSRLMRSYKDFIANLEVTNDTALVILGEVQDPHNVGAVIRSAAAFGVSGVLIPEHRQAPVTGTVVKVSAGMAFRIPLVTIGNVNNAVRDLKEKGFWIYGLDGEAKQSVQDEAFEKPSVFILGNEAGGIREKTLDLCDIPLTIPMHPQAESLNASVSAAVALYAWSSRHPKSTSFH